MFKHTFQAISTHFQPLCRFDFERHFFLPFPLFPYRATLLRDEGADGDPKLQLQDGVAKADVDTGRETKLKLNVDDEAQIEVRGADDTALHLPALKLQLQVAVVV